MYILKSNVSIELIKSGMEILPCRICEDSGIIGRRLDLWQRMSVSSAHLLFLSSRIEHTSKTPPGSFSISDVTSCHRILREVIHVPGQGVLNVLSRGMCPSAETTSARFVTFQTLTAILSAD